MYYHVQTIAALCFPAWYARSRSEHVVMSLLMMTIWSLPLFFPEPRKHCHHHQQQKTFSLVGWILLGQCTHNDDDDSVKAMIPAWFFVSCCYYYYICLWKWKGPFLLVYCILLLACMHGALNCWTLKFFHYAAAAAIDDNVNQKTIWILQCTIWLQRRRW